MYFCQKFRIFKSYDVIKIMPIFVTNQNRPSHNHGDVYTMLLTTANQIH